MIVIFSLNNPQLVDNLRIEGLQVFDMIGKYQGAVETSYITDTPDDRTHNILISLLKLDGQESYIEKGHKNQYVMVDTTSGHIIGVAPLGIREITAATARRLESWSFLGGRWYAGDFRRA